MAVPTLETNGAADILRITDGTSGNPVTWDDVWEWGAGGGAGLVPKDGGGDARVDTFMTEVVTDAVYTIEESVWFGNAGGDATYFLSTNEMIYFADAKVISIRGNAILSLGVLTDSYGVDGSTWSLAPSASMYITFGGGAVCNLYGSVLHSRDSFLGFDWGTLNVNRSFITHAVATSYIKLMVGMTAINIKHLYARGERLLIKKIPIEFYDVHLHSTHYGLAIQQANVTCDGLFVTHATNYDTWVYDAHTLTLKDPKFHVSTPKIDHADGVIIEQYTCNIHVTDKDGVGLVGVNIECIETGGAQEFSVNTDGAGDIAEQTIDYKQWAGTLETLTDYSPHQFILTKAGYKPLYLDNITVDHPIVWELEMPEAVGAYAGAWK